MFSKENVNLVVASVKKALEERAKPLRKLREEQEKIKTNIRRYHEAFEQGLIEMKDIADRLRELKEQENRLAHEIDARSNIVDIPKLFIETEDLEKIQEQLKEVFQNAPTRTKRQYLGALVEYIRFDGEKVKVKAKSDGIIAVLQAGKDLNEENVTAVISQCKNWQPVGDSNPCNGTENPVAMENKGRNTNDLLGDFSQGTPEGTQADAKTSQIDTIRAALAGLSREDLIALLADALKGKEAGREMS